MPYNSKEPSPFRAAVFTKYKYYMSAHNLVNWFLHNATLSYLIGLIRV
jgi:hypothetical protein